MPKHDTTTHQGNEASNIVPSNQPSWEHRPRPLSKLVLNTAKFTRPPHKVRQALLEYVFATPVSIAEFNRQKLRLPYGLWIADDGTAYLFNCEFELLFVWLTDATRPECCDLHWNNVTVQEGGFFYSDRSIYDIGPSNLHQALEALLGAWEHGNRAMAEVLEAWLLGQHKAYQELIQACQKDPA
ncbi:hypothetical protein IGS68_19070 [Skermanella sp. TT6]|uniref:Uncharacterized protein n=1 Tax=Skermanella cutis TaxID=2775420 RepID=A0ABX7B1J6_9PROT|nr:hypothetical protein [Skermanella sp. TT6]QQP88146.1 hypothetical protein IGS68_19070 [Skermanella sp. TT6]